MKLTADTITDEQIRELRSTLQHLDTVEFRCFDYGCCAQCPIAVCGMALHGKERAATDDRPVRGRELARARCAEILNMREQISIADEIVAEVIAEERAEGKS